MDPLTKAYLKIITESEDLQKGQKVEGEKSQTGKVFGNAESEKNKDPQKDTGPEAADDVEKPEDAPAHLQQTNGKIEKNKVSYGEAKNPFDALFNKILSEEGENFSFSTGKNPEDSSFEVAEPFGGESSEEETDEFGEEDSEEGEEVSFSLPRELAERLHEVLSSVLSEEESEEGGEEFGEEESDFGGSEEGEESESEESENPFKEATDMQELADSQGLSLTDKSKKEVKGAVPVTKKTAETPSTGKGHDGAVRSHSTEGGVSKHTAKGSNKVGSVDKVGSSLFEQ